VRSRGRYSIHRARRTTVALNYTTKATNNADECPARRAWVALRGAFLVAAGPASHRVFFPGFCHTQATNNTRDRNPFGYRLKSPRSKQVEPELPRRLLLNLTCIRARAREITRPRLDTSLRRINRIEPILQLQPEVFDEVARVHNAEPGAQSDEPLIPDLLAKDRASVQKIVVVRVGRARLSVVTRRL